MPTEEEQLERGQLKLRARAWLWFHFGPWKPTVVGVTSSTQRHLMSNRTDYHEVARELQEMFGLSHQARERIETELHNAHMAGQEGSACRCRWCPPPTETHWFDRVL
jgi:hypothetical protein